MVSSVISPSLKVLVFSLERAHHRELQLVDLDDLVECRVQIPEHPDCQLLAEHGDVLPQGHVALVKTPAAQDNQITNVRILVVDAVKRDLANLSPYYKFGVRTHNGRGCNNLVGQLSPNSLHIGELHEVCLYLGRVLAAGLVRSKYQIRSNASDQVENEVFAGQRNGHNEDDRCVPDDQTEGGQKSTEAISLQSLQTETNGLGQVHREITEGTCDRNLEGRATATGRLAATGLLEQPERLVARRIIRSNG